MNGTESSCIELWRSGKIVILSDNTIKSYIETKKLTIDPFEESNIQPASIDFRLGNHFKIFDHINIQELKLNDPDIKFREFNKDTFYIKPQSFILATTVERIELPSDLTAFVEGRSSIGRIGLFIQNAGWVDPGFKGQITLELFNANSVPIELKAQRRICQIVFCKMDKPAKKPYKGKYQNQTGTTISKIFEEKS